MLSILPPTSGFALKWALTQANKVTYVPAGNYVADYSSGAIYVAQGVTLYGDGQSETGTVINFSNSADYAEQIMVYNVDNVVFSNFRMTGYGNIVVYATTTDLYSLTFDHVTAYRCGGNDFTFAILAYNSHKIDGVTFTNCIAYGCDGWGFVLSGDSTGLKTNVAFTDCSATYCGSFSTRFNEWGVGFDICEIGKVSNVVLTRCTASYNWEAGFHFEWNRVVTNVKIVDCVADYNGQKPASNDNKDGTYGPQFSQGYLFFPGEDVTLKNCRGVGNTLGLVYYDLYATVINPSATSVSWKPTFTNSPSTTGKVGVAYSYTPSVNESASPLLGHQADLGYLVRDDDVRDSDGRRVIFLLDKGHLNRRHIVELEELDRDRHKRFG